MRNTAAKEISNYCRKNKDGFLIAGDASCPLTKFSIPTAFVFDFGELFIISSEL